MALKALRFKVRVMQEVRAWGWLGWSFSSGRDTWGLWDRLGHAHGGVHWCLLASTIQAGQLSSQEAADKQKEEHWTWSPAQPHGLGQIISPVTSLRLMVQMGIAQSTSGNIGTKLSHRRT